MSGLPPFIAIKSTTVGKYLIYVDDPKADEVGRFMFGGDDPTDSKAKFEVKEASTPGLVHIKCSHNHKYVRRVSIISGWLTPEADGIDEDQDKWSCTLFQPNHSDPHNKKLVQFFHVQRKQCGTATKVDEASGYRFLLDNSNAQATMEIFNLRP